MRITTGTGKAGVESKRVDDRWKFFTFFVAIAIFLVNTIPIIWYYKIIIILIVILSLAYLCYWNLKSQDIILKFQNKIEGWRKVQ